MAYRAQFENSNDIGVFTKLTNTYCLVGIGAAQNYYRYGCPLLSSAIFLGKVEASSGILSLYAVPPNAFF